MAREPQTAFAGKRGPLASHPSGRRGIRRWPPGATDFAAARRDGDDADRTPSQDGGGDRRADPSLGIALRQQLFQNVGAAQERAQPGGRTPHADEAAVHRDIVELLEGLNATIDVARHVLTTATDALEKQADDLQQQTALQVPLLPQSRPPRRRRWVLGSAASALVVLIGGGWLLYDGVSVVNETPTPQAPIKVVKTRPAETVPGPQRTPAQAAVIPPPAPSEPTAPVQQAEARTETPAAPAEPLRGRPGEPIPLGIEAPQLEGGGEVSVMVQALPQGARLTAGQRLGGDTWILKAEQIPDAALLLPNDFAADQVVLDLTFVSSDGRIPEAHSIVALVEQAPAPASPAQAPDAVAAVAPAPAQQSPEAAAAPVEAPDAPAAASPDLAPEARPAETQQASVPPSEEASQFVPGQAAPQIRDGTSEEVQPTTEQTQGPSAPSDATVTTAEQTLTPPPAEAGASDASITAAINEASEPAATESASAPTPPAEETKKPQTEPASDKANDKASDTAEPTRTASVNTDVNMRARPDNDAEVLAVAPRGSSVEVIRCRAWCEVIFKGKRGFIYKGFVEGGAAASASGAASAGAGTQTASGGALVVRSQARTSQGSQGWFGRIRSLLTPSR